MSEEEDRYAIFKVLPDGDVSWVVPAESIPEGQRKMKTLSARSPRTTYFLYDVLMGRTVERWEAEWRGLGAGMN